jgi:lipoate-protein ligase A
MEDLFEMMCRGCIHALEILGISASFRPKNDIEVKGRKISGTGGTERDNAFLFQGTLLVDFDVETMIRALRIPIVKLKDKELRSAKERVTCIKWELGYHPNSGEIKNAMKRGFEEVFRVDLVEEELSPIEKKLLGEHLPKFASNEWIFLDRYPLNEAGMFHTIDKKPGGLIRVSLALDTRINLIKSVLITGDFFIFPQRAILDLEAALKYTYLEENVIRSTLHNFFKANQVQMIGITPDDLTNMIFEAAQKTSYQSFGVSTDETNHLYPITSNAKAILDKGCDYLLLPYCAKLPTCKYRQIEGCEKCGECSIGEVYEAAESYNMKIQTIQNFEHLIHTLKVMKQKKAKGWIGCCCEAFYCKHRDEMEEIKVPGLIIDIEDQTCYDLGKMEEGYQGDFETQTQLRTELLLKILKHVNENKERINT